MHILDKITGKFNLPLGFKRYFLNTGWMFLEKIVRIFTGLFVGIYVARYLGPEQFGILSYAISLVALFTAFSNLGLDGILVREFVEKNKDDHHNILGTAFILKFVVSLLVFLLFVGLVTFSGGEKGLNVIILIIAAGLIFKSFDVIQFFYESQVLSKYYVHAQLFAILTIAFLKLVFIYLKLPLIYFAVAISAESLLLAAGLIFIYFKKSHTKSWIFNKDTALSLLKNSWPLILSGLAVSVYMRIDQVMIKYMLDAESVGQYAAAVRLSEVWYFVPVVICSSFFPSIINAKKCSEALYYKRLQMLFGLVVWIGITVALGTSFLSPWIIKTLYGVAFSEASSVLKIYIWTGAFVGLGAVSSKWFILENYFKKNLYRILLGMLINIVFNIYLIPSYGIKGAAVATLLGQLTANLLYDLFDKQLHKSLKLKIKAFLPFYFMKNERRQFN